MIYRFTTYGAYLYFEENIILRMNTGSYKKIGVRELISIMAMF